MIYLVPIIFYLIGLFINLVYLKLESRNFYVEKKDKDNAFKAIKAIYPSKSDDECNLEYY